MSEDWYCKWCHSERDGDHNFGCFMDDRQNTDMPLLTRKADERIRELEAENERLDALRAEMGIQRNDLLLKVAELEMQIRATAHQLPTLKAEVKQLRRESVEQQATIMTLRQKLRGEK